MVNHSPNDYKLHAIDIDDELLGTLSLDTLLLFTESVDDVALQTCDQYDVCLDEHIIASLKNYDTNMRARMARVTWDL